MKKTTVAFKLEIKVNTTSFSQSLFNYIEITSVDLTIDIYLGGTTLY